MTETALVDGQDDSEAVNDRAELDALIAETAGPQKEDAPKPVDIDALKVERLTAKIAPVHVLSTHTKVLLFGDQGTSKTTSSMHAPSPLLMAIEAGQKSLLNHEATRNAQVMEIADYRQVEDVGYLTANGKFGEQFETYVLDTFSELEKQVLSDRVYTQWLSQQQTRERYKPEGSDYQTSGEHMRQIAAQYRDVPKNVIFVCQEVLKNGVYQPALPDKVLAKLGEYCDVVARMTSDWSDPENPKFMMQTRRTTGILAKSRIKILPTLGEGLTFDHIHRANMKQINDAKEGKK